MRSRKATAATSTNGVGWLSRWWTNFCFTTLFLVSLYGEVFERSNVKRSKRLNILLFTLHQTKTKTPLVFSGYCSFNQILPTYSLAFGIDTFLQIKVDCQFVSKAWLKSAFPFNIASIIHTEFQRNVVPFEDYLVSTLEITQNCGAVSF